jgi:hypothetical protein
MIVDPAFTADDLLNNQTINETQETVEQQFAEREIPALIVKSGRSRISDSNESDQILRNRFLIVILLSEGSQLGSSSLLVSVSEGSLIQSLIEERAGDDNQIRMISPMVVELAVSNSVIYFNCLNKINERVVFELVLLGDKLEIMIKMVAKSDAMHQPEMVFDGSSWYQSEESMISLNHYLDEIQSDNNKVIMSRFVKSFLNHAADWFTSIRQFRLLMGNQCIDWVLTQVIQSMVDLIDNYGSNEMYFHLTHCGSCHVCLNWSDHSCYCNVHAVVKSICMRDIKRIYIYLETDTEVQLNLLRQDFCLLLNRNYFKDCYLEIDSIYRHLLCLKLFKRIRSFENFECKCGLLKFRMNNQYDLVDSFELSKHAQAILDCLDEAQCMNQLRFISGAQCKEGNGFDICTSELQCSNVPSNLFRPLQWLMPSCCYELTSESSSDEWIGNGCKQMLSKRRAMLSQKFNKTFIPQLETVTNVQLCVKQVSGKEIVANRMSLRLNAYINRHKVPYIAFVDSGCPVSVIHIDTVRQLKLPTVHDPNSVDLFWGDGASTTSNQKLVTKPVKMVIEGHEEDISFSVIESGEETVMLGYSWLAKHNPSIDWGSGKVTWNSNYCKVNCFNGFDVNLDEIKEFADRQIIGMMMIPSEGVIPDEQHFVVVCNDTPAHEVLSKAPRSVLIHKVGDRVLKVKSQSLSQINSFGDSVEGDRRAYFLLSIKHGVVSVVVDDHKASFSSRGDGCQSTPVDNEGDGYDLQEAFQELTEEDKESFPVEYLEYIDVFAKSRADILPHHRKWDIAIETIDNFTPKWGPIYNLSELEMKALKDYIDENLSKGFIRPSSSPCGAPVLFVPKKGGKLRLCVDYRALNAVTVKDRYPLPLIDGMLDRLKAAKIYTKLDLKGAYNLTRIKEGHEWKTAFRSRYGHYEYLVMPFGLTNAPAVFQRLMNDIFREYLDVFVVVYLDDILIYSASKEEHENHVKIVLQLLRDNKLYCEYSKCVFHTIETEFLGFIISTGGLKMAESKVKSILDWEVPKSKIGVMSFLGFANYYRRFIKNYAKIAAPLHETTHREGAFKWSTKAQEAFELLKHAFVQAPVLKYVDFNKPFVVETDSSNFAVGCVLSQLFNDVLHPVAYYSKKLSGCETRWEIHDKELFGIITALKVWRHYLVSSQEPVQIFTDHKNLQWFMTKQKLNARQLRWMMFLADYNFVIQYKEGRLMGKADALSRRQEYTDVLIKEKETERLLLGSDRVNQKIFDELEAKRGVIEETPSTLNLIMFSKAGLANCHLIKKVFVPNRTTLLDKIRKSTLKMKLFKDLLDPKSSNNVNSSRYSVKEGLIYLGNRIVIEDDDCKVMVLQYLHDAPSAGHFGNKKTKELVRRDFIWDGMDKYIDDYIRSCDLCQRAKKPKHKPFGLIHSLPVPVRPWIDIGMDFVGPLPSSNGFNLILVVICRLTKQAHFIPCQDTINSAQLSQLMQDNIVRLHGFPKSIVSDRGTLFTSKFWMEFMRLMNVQHHLSTAHHQQSDGVTERVIQTLKQYLRLFINYRMNDWFSCLSLAEFAYNNAMHSSIGISPFKANYGFDFHLFEDEFGDSSVPAALDKADSMKEIHQQLQSAMVKAQTMQKYYADQRRKSPPDFKVGNKVWLATTNLITKRVNKSLDFKRIGPFKITEVLPNDNFRLELPTEMKGMHDVFHVNLLEKYYENTITGRETLPPPPVSVLVGEEIVDEYEVESIVDSRCHRNKMQYLVHWKGYGIDERSWLSIDELTNAQEAVKLFHDNNPDACSECVSAVCHRPSRRKRQRKH